MGYWGGGVPVVISEDKLPVVGVKSKQKFNKALPRATERPLLHFATVFIIL